MMGKCSIRRCRSWIFIVLLALLLSGCSAEKPEERENRKISPTPITTQEDTPTPQATPTDVPDVTPTDTPEVTPTDVPEVSPTEAPEITPTEVPTAAPTAIPTATLTPATATTVTPTPTATPTPTQAPTATPTPTKAPTPTATQGKPAVAAKEGPLYVIGTVYCKAGYEAYEEDFSGRMSAEQMYLVEPGYPKLMEKIQETNFRALEMLNDVLEKSIEAREDGKGTDEFSFSCKFDMVRSDTVLFSFVQRIAYCDSQWEKAYTVGSTFDTVTGEEISLRSLVKDYAQLQTIVTNKLEARYKNDFPESDWKSDLNLYFESDILKWVATEAGLRIWFYAGELTDESVGEIYVDVKINDYPQLFVEKYIGNYNGSFSVKRFDYSKNCPAEYNKVLVELVHGIGNMTYNGVLNLFKRGGVEYFEGDVVDSEPSIGMFFSSDNWYLSGVDTRFDHDGTEYLTYVSIGGCFAGMIYDDSVKKTVVKYGTSINGSSDIFDAWVDVYFPNLESMAQAEFGYSRYYEYAGYYDDED